MPTNSQYYSISNKQPYNLLGSPLNCPGRSNFTFCALNTLSVAFVAVIAEKAVNASVNDAKTACLALLYFSLSPILIVKYPLVVDSDHQRSGPILRLITP